MAVSFIGGGNLKYSENRLKREYVYFNSIELLFILMVGKLIFFYHVIYCYKIHV